MPNPLRISDRDARDVRLYRNAKAEAARLGVQLVIDEAPRPTPGDFVFVPPQSPSSPEA